MSRPKLPLSAERSPALRAIPKVHALLETGEARSLLSVYGRAAVVEAIRAELSDLRQRLLVRNGHPIDTPSSEAVLAAVARRLAEQNLARLTRVINATGIVLHTNMGRAPLADRAAAAVAQIAAGYSNLELDLATGERGRRGGEIEGLLTKLTGAESALVVNNNAAGVLLALDTVARGHEVVISRGELVEIGGAFRVPDVIRASGAEMVEVGTTNKTRLSDYARGISPETRVLLKVHPSNYRMVGFVGETTVRELAGLAAEHALIVMQDLGSGALVDLTRWGLPHEPTVQDALRAGADIVTISGDKLLGGPQCGIIVGKAEYVRPMATNPLFRALRAGKMALGALEATLRLYLDEPRLVAELPVLQMLTEPLQNLERRARRLRARLAKIPDLSATVARGEGFAGGGSLPEASLPTWRVAVHREGMSPDKLAEQLRRGRPPIIGMVAEGSLVIDVRTIAEAEVSEIAAAFAALARVEDKGIAVS